MHKLTDAQLITLSKAAARDDGAAVALTAMTKQAATKLAARLVAQKLMREIRAKPGAAVWRTDRDGRSFSLIITRAGRDVIGAIKGAGAPEPSADEAPVAGGASAEDRSACAKASQSASSARRSRRRAQGAGEPVGGTAAEAAAAADQDASIVPAPASPRAGSKQALLIHMMAKPKGVTLEALVAATGWLPHTTRAALTGLRKRGFAIERERREGEAASIYRVVGSAKSAA